MEMITIAGQVGLTTPGAERRSGVFSNVVLLGWMEMDWSKGSGSTKTD